MIFVSRTSNSIDVGLLYLHFQHMNLSCELERVCIMGLVKLHIGTIMGTQKLKNT